MAYIDALCKVMAAQAFTAAAVSLSSFDLSLSGGLGTPPKREIFTGEPMGFAISVDVAASATTVLIEGISATDAALTAAILVHATDTQVAAAFPAGALHFLVFTQGLAAIQRFIGLRVTPAGGAATVTLSAWLTPHSMFSITPPIAYAKNYTP